MQPPVQPPLFTLPTTVGGRSGTNKDNQAVALVEGKGKIEMRPGGRTYSCAGHHVTVPVVMCVAAVAFFAEAVQRKNCDLRLSIVSWGTMHPARLFQFTALLTTLRKGGFLRSDVLLLRVRASIPPTPLFLLYYSLFLAGFIFRCHAM